MEAGNGHPEGCKCAVCAGKNNSCGCGCCGHWGKGHSFFIIRIIIAIILAVVIFWGGFMLGELHATLWGYGGGYSSGWGHGGWGMMGEVGAPMPVYYYRTSTAAGQQVSGSAATAVPSSATAPIK